MKKIFTLMAAAAMAVSASAQGIYKSPGENITAETVLVDNEDLSVKTVFDTKGGLQEVNFCGEDFSGWFQLRVAGDPTEGNLTGDAQSDCTPLIVEVKNKLTFTIYDRRQKGSNGYNPGDNKGILAINQANLEKVASSIELDRYDGKPDETTGVIPDSYGFCKESFDFEPGTYTLYRKGSTMRIFGFKWESGSGVANVEVEGAVEYYNLQGVRVANPENGIFIKRQGNKAVKVLVK